MQCCISNMVPQYYRDGESSLNHSTWCWWKPLLHIALVERIGNSSILGHLDPDRVTRTLGWLEWLEWLESKEIAAWVDWD